MLHKLKINYLPILKDQRYTEDRDLSFHNQLLEILRTFFADNDSEIKAVGTTIMSKAPNIEELISVTDGPFIPKEHFENAFFSGQKNMFAKDNKNYILQFIPFLYSGADITSGVLNTKTLVEVNVLSSDSHFHTTSYGSVHDVPLFTQHIYEVVDVVDAIVNFYTVSGNTSSRLILPFYTLEHFIKNCFFPEDITLLYNDWLTWYQAIKAILIASQSPHKIVLGLLETDCKKSVVSLSDRQKNSLQLYDFYKSPRSAVSAKMKENCDTVIIETFNCFEHGDIVTIVSWLKGGNKQGTEFYYHVSDNSQFLNELGKDCSQKSPIIQRSALDFFDNIDRLDVLKQNPGLH